MLPVVFLKYLLNTEFKPHFKSPEEQDNIYSCGNDVIVDHKWTIWISSDNAQGGNWSDICAV